MRNQLVGAERAQAGDVDDRNHAGGVLGNTSGMVTPNSARVLRTPSAGWS